MFFPQMFFFLIDVYQGIELRRHLGVDTPLLFFCS